MEEQEQKQTYWHVLNRTSCRFLLAFVCFILCLIINILSNHGIIFETFDFSNIEKLTYLNTLPFLLPNLGLFFILVTILQESKNLSVLTTRIINSIGFLFFAGFFFLYHDTEQMLIDLYWVSSIVSLVFLVSPYLNLNNKDNHSVWCFSHKLIKGSFLSSLIAVLLYSSVSIALFTIEKLFQFNIPSTIYQDVLFIASLISMIYFLSIIPKEFSFTQDDGKRSKTMQFVINWISIPMSFVYAVILYAYFLKISIISDTSYVTIRALVQLITGFVCVSILVFWSSFTLKETGKVHVRLFHKIFPYLILPPICINLYYSVQNINLVGSTVSWYALLIISVWYLFVVVACGIQKLSIKYIIVSLAVCIFWAGLSPWSIKKIAIHNGVNLEKMIMEAMIPKQPKPPTPLSPAPPVTVPKHSEKLIEK